MWLQRLRLACRVCLDAALSHFCLENLLPVIGPEGIWLKPWAAAWARHMLLPQATKIDCFAAACSCLDFNHRENSPGAHNSLFQAVASTKQPPMWLPGQAKSNGFAGSMQAAYFFRQMIQGCNQTSPKSTIWFLSLRLCSLLL